MKQLEVKRGPDGVYYARPYLGTNSITGKPMRPYKRFPDAATEEEALAQAQEWLACIVPAAEMHVAQRLDQLLQKYIDNLSAMNMSPGTIKAYQSSLDCYVAPYLGAEDPDEVKPYMVTGLYNTLLLSGSKKGEPISPSTVLKTHWFLCGAYKWFVSQGICQFDPMRSVDKPSPDVAEAVAFNESEFSKIACAIDGVLHEPAESREAIFRRNAVFAAYLALWTGARCGEICALVRDDAQLVRSLLHISHNMVEEKGKLWRRPKTKGKKSRNVAITEDVCEHITMHYVWQSLYIPQTPYSDLSKKTICAAADGGYMRPSKVSEAFKDMRNRLHLSKNTSFHTLRHTHAPWLLMNGVDMRTIMERMGHASISTTLGIYSHVMPGRDQAAANAFGDVAKRIGDAYG